MNRQIAGIDHAIIAVRDLERARATYQRLGFALTPPGRHAGRGTGNHCMMFEHDYVELLGIVDPQAPLGGFGQFLAEAEGPAAVALRSDDPEATHAAWQEAGLQPAAVADFERLMPGGDRLRFRNVELPAEATRGIPMFACTALTPEGMRHARWLEHPNGARGIESITVVVDDPTGLAASMGAVFGHTRLTDTDDTLAVHTGRGVLLLVTPDDLEVMHPELETVLAPGRPTIAALTLLVADADASAAWLEHQGVPFQRRAGGAIGIAPAHACGAMLELTAAPKVWNQPFG
jgi:catechol 2,3-dioxygenase-like lactoylglutathione lyase family enzyme